MITNLIKSFAGGSKQMNPIRGNYTNLLNQILYQWQVNNNGVVWFDTAKREEFINKGYKGNHMVYAIIRKIASKVKLAKLQVFVNSDSQKTRKYKIKKFSKDILVNVQSRLHKKSLEYIEDETDPLVRFLKKPNPFQTIDELIELQSTFYESTGECFWYVVKIEDGINKGLPKEIYAMPPQYTDIVQGTWEDIISGYKLRIGNTIKEIRAEDVLHMKTPQIGFDTAGLQLRGQPPLQAGFRLVTANDSAIEALTKAIQNEGVKGMLTPPDTLHPDYWLDTEQKAALDQAIEKQANNSSNRNRITSASLPLKYLELGLSPTNLALVQALEMSSTPLANLWGVNPALFNPNTTFANLEEAKKQMVVDVTLPFLETLEAKLQTWLVPMFKEVTGVDYVLDFDTSLYPELQPDLKLIKEVYGDNPAFTWNELRIMLNWDESEDEGANLHWVPMGLNPSTDAINPLPLDGKAKFDDYN
jgi:phage portal protein BeeE